MSLPRTFSHANKNPDLQETSSIEKLTLKNKDASEMEAIYGWLSSDMILYSKRLKNEDLPQLMTWNLKSNEHRVFYNPTAPISAVSISPSKSYVSFRQHWKKKCKIIY